jgi:transaldolase
MVLKGQSMVAKMADAIENKLEDQDISGSFLSSSKEIIQTNIYYKIVSGGLCKFGNDSATGLRWVRHLGAVQVSSNPVIAARAFEEIPDLWKSFERVVMNHPEWRKDPVKFQDEIALFGTVVSLLPNVLDFRPIALLSNFKDGMVSIQLNPIKASSIEGSVQDAQRINAILQEILRNYDFYLTSGKAEKRVPKTNVVFKVSTSGTEAIHLTEELDMKGLGTNNTVAFTVSQEIKILISVIRGLVGALKGGTEVPRVYITNMEGRLEDHLRESLAKELLLAGLEKVSEKGEGKIDSIVTELGALDDLDGKSLEEKIEFLCSKRYLKTLNDRWFVEFLGREKYSSSLEQMESDIRMSGIFVTRRVFELAFSPQVRPKWLEYVMKQFGLSTKEAIQVIDAIDLLPSSKRREEDTLLVLGSKEIHNLTNTEFPDQQTKVWLMSKEENFELSKFENSISDKPDSSVLKRLLQMKDFRKAYELTPELAKELREQIGIPSLDEDEAGGLEPEDWQSYGPVMKTMKEFKHAYLHFRGELVQAVEKMYKDK